MKTTIRIAIGPFSYLEFEGSKKDLKEMENLFNTYSEIPRSFQQGVFEEFETFTGEKIRYNAETHQYQDMTGNALISGSQYAKTQIKPFNKELMSSLIGKKYGVEQKTVGEMWEGNGNISATFGTALHLAMEHWFKHKDNGTEKNYHLPKHPFLKAAVETFPLKDENILPEIMISDIEHKFVGQVDGLLVLGGNENGQNVGSIIDYKTDVECEKNLDKHSHQLNFYRTILENHGWKIESLQIWNYVEEWKKFDLEINEITL